MTLQSPYFNRWSAQLFSHLVAFSGFVTTGAWLLGFRRFNPDIPGDRLIASSSSVAFLLSGLALIIYNYPSRSPSRRILIFFLTGTMLLIALSSAIAVWPWMHIQATGANSTLRHLVPGHLSQMSYTATLEFMLIGTAIVLMTASQRECLFRRILVALVFLISVFALASLALSESNHPVVPDFRHMTPLTALFFILTAGAVFFSDETNSILVLMHQRGKGTRIAQLIFLLSFTIPLLTELIVHLLIHSGWMDHGNSKAVGVLLNGIIFACMAVLIGRWIRHSEQLIEKSLQRLEESEANLRDSEQRLRELVGRLTVVEEETRKQAAMVLHDQVGQNLTALIISLQHLSHLNATGNSEAVDKTLVEALAILRETVQQTKSVIYELRPAVLDDYGLYPAIRWYAGQLSGRAPVKVTADGNDLKYKLSTATEYAMFRIVQESCTNSLRHSGATAIDISLNESEYSIRLEVRDDGSGFDPEFLHLSGRPSLGLTGMKERALSIGGSLQIRSLPGAGTRVILTLAKDR